MATVTERKKPSQTPLHLKKTFTTGDVAKHAGVAPRTVSMWCDTGRLASYRIPGGKDRRIPREGYISFLKENGMPTYGLHDGCRVLLIGTGDMLAARLGELLPADEGFAFGRAESAFESGLQLREFAPEAVVLDLALGRSEALAIARRLAADPVHGTIPLIVLAGEDESDMATLEACGFAAVFRKPFDPELLAEALRGVAT